MRTSRFPREIGSGPMADIAFLLLIFFLVTTTIDTDEGIPTQLAPLNGISIPSREKLDILVNGNNEVMTNGQLTSMEEVSAEVFGSLKRYGHENMVVSLQNDRETTYSIYVMVYDAIRTGYRLYRDDFAIRNYGRSYSLLSETDQQEVKREIPIRISEASPVNEAVFSGSMR